MCGSLLRNAAGENRKSDATWYTIVTFCQRAILYKKQQGGCATGCIGTLCGVCSGWTVLTIGAGGSRGQSGICQHGADQEQERQGNGQRHGGRRARRGIGRGWSGAVRVASGLHPDIGGLRHRVGQRVALSLHHGRVRRRGVRAHVPGVPGHFGPAGHGDGVRRGPRKPEERRAGVRHAAAVGHVALVLVVGLRRVHGAHDVLHHGGRLDAVVRGEDGHGRVQRPGQRGRGRRVQRHAGEPN